MSSCKSVSEDSGVTPVIQKISPRVIPGALTGNNKGAIDWGWQSFVAYGCHNHVIIVDTTHVKVFQTLAKHKSDVVKVKWSRENHYHDLSAPYNLRLASVDTAGFVVIWDVVQASSLFVLCDGNKQVNELEWVPGGDSSFSYLLTLHQPSSLILWNVETGTKVWKKTYSEILQSFSFDPFTLNNLAFLASDCILFVDDFHLKKCPSSVGRKLYISNSSSTSGSSVVGSQMSLNTLGNSVVANEDKGKSGSRSLARRMKVLIGVETKSSPEESIALNECLQLCYHRAYRHHLLLLYTKEILILDLEINQTVGIVCLERNGYPLMMMYSCTQRDALLCLHEPGSVSLRLRQKVNLGSSSWTDDSSPGPSDSFLEVSYDMQCQSEPLRHTKYSKVVGMTVNPLTECQVCLLVNDGRIMFLDLLSAANQPKLFGNTSSPVLGQTAEQDHYASDRNPYTRLVPFAGCPPFPNLFLEDIVPSSLYNRDANGVKWSPKRRSFGLKFILTGMLANLSPPPHVMRMCPPVTYRNWTFYKPLLCLGNGNGNIQVINMSSGVVEQEFSIHTAPVRGIEWVSLMAFLSFAYPNIMSGQVRNELFIVDVLSGRSHMLRADINEESPIEMIKVSYQKQYFIIAFREQPFELWDLNNLTLLRTMPTFPTVTALEWSPLHSRKPTSQHDNTDESVRKVDTSINSNILESQFTKPVALTKEYFVFTDTDGQLFNFSVEGNIVREGARIPSESGMATISCLAWKADQIILGDVDGNLNLWNLKTKLSRCIPTNRGCVKKIRFAPGRGNMKILVMYNEGADLWDVKEGQLVSQVKCPKDMPKIQDLDWASSERPVFCTADGCLRVLDITLRNCTSPFLDYQLEDIPFSPFLLSTKGAFNLKSHLQSRPQDEDDVMLIKDTGLAGEDVYITQRQLQILDQQIKASLVACPFGTAQRCLLVARLFGDENDVLFWTVALHYLKRHVVLLTEETRKNVNGTDLKGDASLDAIGLDQVINEPFIEAPLDTGFDILVENEVYQARQLEQLRLHDLKRSSYNQTQCCIESLLLLKQWDRAVQLLLETESNGANFYPDCLRACLVATVKSSSTSQSVIKLVATNLIASGKISEGVQLLCLIEKGLDACRYLQGAGQWDKAVWLAKCTLDPPECLEVLRRWVDHLILDTQKSDSPSSENLMSVNINQRSKGLLVLLSQCQFWKVLTLLHQWGMVERAALFLMACQEFGAIFRTQPNAELQDDILLKYAQHLCSIGNYPAALSFCEKVGSAAEDLKKKIQEFIETA